MAMTAILGALRATVRRARARPPASVTPPPPTRRYPRRNRAHLLASRPWCAERATPTVGHRQDGEHRSPASTAVLAVALAILWAPLLAYGQIRIAVDAAEGAGEAPSVIDWKTACAPVPQSAEFGAEHVRFEHCLRTFRFRRLAADQGVQAPAIEPLVLAAAESPVDYDVPTLRLAWDSHTFFDTADDQLLEQIVPIVDLVALALKLDIGDTSLYVVGHTDSRGNSNYNENLSRRRAKSVVEHLADAGVPRYQINYTGMGERQPVASNGTEEGRSLNRRVEFLISAFREVNTALVRTRAINEAWLDDHETFGTVVKRTVEVFSLDEGKPPEVFELPPPISHSTYIVEVGGLQ